LFILLTFGILSKISSGQKYFETIGDFDREYDTLEKQRKLIIKCSLLLENFNRLFWEDSDQFGKLIYLFSRMTKILAKTVSVVALFQVLLCYYTVSSQLKIWREKFVRKKRRIRSFSSFFYVRFVRQFV
jgi:hypothetical protein